MPAPDSHRGIWIATTAVTFFIGWMFGATMSISTPSRNQYLTLDKEQQEDERELELIRSVSIGDAIALYGDLLMLVDIVYTTAEPDFDQLFNFLSDNSTQLPPASECQIWNYDLFNLELEGTKQYYLIVHDGRIVAICPGYSVTQ